mgnify:FL=1
MKFNSIKIILLLTFFMTILSGCAEQMTKMKTKKTFKHNTPLIKEDVKKLGKKEVEKSAEMGPTPIEGDVKKLKKRKKISSVKEKNYILIPDEYMLLKQKVTFKFQNLDYKEAMSLMAKVGDVNILVGEEVAGSISAELSDVPWDKAFNALLDMKNFAADIDVASNIIRIHSPSTLTSQESYKSARAAAVRKKVELENSVEPVVSEIFRLYYITPSEAKATISELFTEIGGGAGYNPIQITEEKTTRSIIVRGKEKDLDVVDKVIREIDVRTKQVLIEAFIVEATSSFERALGNALGAAYTRKGIRAGGTVGGTTVGAPSGSGADISSTTAAISSAGSGGSDSLFNFNAAGATSGIGVLKKTGSAVLKLQIEALEKEGLGKTISNPKLFTLDNQVASITQGVQIPVAGSGDTAPSFKDAALKLTVTPSIIGDGNVLLDVKVNNDTPDRTNPGAVGINKMEINTKLLIADGDIVVIGGIKKNEISDAKEQVPGMGNIPIIGKMFQGREQVDKMNELLVFIAPRIL